VKVGDTLAATRTILGVIAVATATVWAPAAADAQSFPSRPINMIVPFPPGGNTDIMARALQNEISRKLGQTVIIINKGGAAGTIGMIELARAAPDGYTIALTPNNPLTAQPKAPLWQRQSATFVSPISRPTC
jgi:tripartite-type tricarboxylate transporter receptor subunit TctC